MGCSSKRQKCITVTKAFQNVLNELSLKIKTCNLTEYMQIKAVSFIRD